MPARVISIPFLLLTAVFAYLTLEDIILYITNCLSMIKSVLETEWRFT